MNTPANDNQKDPTEGMSPWAAMLFECFRPVDLRPVMQNPQTHEDMEKPL